MNGVSACLFFRTKGKPHACTHLKSTADDSRRTMFYNLRPVILQWICPSCGAVKLRIYTYVRNSIICTIKSRAAIYYLFLIPMLKRRRRRQDKQTKGGKTNFHTKYTKEHFQVALSKPQNRLCVIIKLTM